MPLTKSGAHLSSLTNLSLADDDAGRPAPAAGTSGGASRFHPGAGHHHLSGLPMHP